MKTVRTTRNRTGVMIAGCAIVALSIGAMTAMVGTPVSPPRHPDGSLSSTAAKGSQSGPDPVPQPRDEVAATIPPSEGEDTGTPTPPPASQPDPATPAPDPTTPAPVNLPPSIDDPGISSTSLDLVVAPEVSDPDGSISVVVVRIDGTPIEARDGHFAVGFDRDQVGDDHVAIVEVTAIDDRGATTTERFEHRLRAIDRVTVGPIVYRLDGTGCFGGRRIAERASGVFELRGPVTASVSLDEELRPDRLSIEIVPAQTVEIAASESEPVWDVSRFVVGDVNEFHTKSTQGNATVLDPIGAGRRCAGTLSYTIQIEEV